eukprot:5961473-Alexandrium_andersonii.AAC.1
MTSLGTTPHRRSCSNGVKVKERACVSCFRALKLAVTDSAKPEQQTWPLGPALHRGLAHDPVSAR